ncbi:MAG: glycosyltransferase family 4 protein [Prosthecobacter sp.]
MSNQPVHVCLVIRQFWPTLAGAAERMRRYAPGLSLREVKMVVVCFWRDGLSRTECLEDGTQIVRVEKIGTLQDADAALFKQAAVCLQQLPEGRRVLQTNLLGPHTVHHIARLVANGIPAVYLGTMNEVEPEKNSLIRRWLRAWRLRRLFHPFAAAVVGSESMRHWLLNSGVAPAKVHQIGHGVDLARFHPSADSREKNALRRQFNLPETAWIVLFVGTMTERKGVHLLVNAWNQIQQAKPNTMLVMLGAFDRPTVMKSEQRAELHQFQEQLRQSMEPLINCGTLIHHEHTPDIQHWMQVADALVLPSAKEGVPNVVLEAMACSLPCVLTRFQGFPEDELGEEGVHYLITERCVTGLAQALLQLQENPSQGAQIGAAAFKWARCHFDLNLTLDRYVDLYHNLVRPD